MRSDNIKKGIAHTPHRALLMATGVSKQNMDAPFIIYRFGSGTYRNERFGTSN